MNFVTRQSLSRRTVLRGMGASISLPLLDAMVPAATAAPAVPAKRLGFVFMPMGADLSRWTPGSSDTLDELSPILQSLAPVRNHLTAYTNLELQPAYQRSGHIGIAGANRVLIARLARYHRGSLAAVLVPEVAPSHKTRCSVRPHSGNRASG